MCLETQTCFLWCLVLFGCGSGPPIMKVAVNETRGLALNLDSQVTLSNLSRPQFLVGKINGPGPFMF